MGKATCRTVKKLAGPGRLRKLRLFGWERDIITPNTEIHKDRFLSRVLARFPFLVEVWYWALIYWVCLSLTSGGR